MSRTKQKNAAETRAMEFLEEAFRLLRGLPLSAWVRYYFGAVPFYLGVLFFWADMSLSATAGSRAGAAALGIALLYAWMKVWQGLFCRAIIARLNPLGALPRLGVAGIFRRTAALLCAHAFAAPAYAIGFSLLLPAGWVAAFFQNTTACAYVIDDRGQPLRQLVEVAARQTHFRPKQNHAALFCLFITAVLVFLSVAIALGVLPHLWRAVSGHASAFTELGVAVIGNTTFLAASVAITFLIMGPYIRATYALRCFYGIARTSGADLLHQLGAMRAKRAPGALAAALMLAAAAIPTAAPAQDAAADPPADRVASPTTSAAQAAEMDAAIRDVLAAPRYEWRMDRSRGDAREEESGWLADMVRSATDAGKRGYEAAGRWIERMFGLGDAGGGSEFGDGQTMSSGTVTLMSTTVLVAVTAVLAWWLFSKRRRPAQSAPHEIAGGPVDLESEQLVADQLPEDEWLALAREKAGLGEFRLAIRAFFLAGLASLGGRDLVRIAKHKSNRDYAREVARSARGDEALQSAFSENTAAFERAWYGRFSPGKADADAFAQRFEVIAAKRR